MHYYSDFSHMRNDRACHVQRAEADKGLLVNISSFLFLTAYQCCQELAKVNGYDSNTSF